MPRLPPGRGILMTLLLVLAMIESAPAVDRGQFGDVPDDVKEWFKRQRSPAGIPCCDIADGHRTSYDVRNGKYWVPIEGAWWEVPDKAVIRDSGNPVGEAIVWYVHHGGSIVISCSIPADST